MAYFFFEWYVDHLDLHVLTHSVPTRRSSDRGAGAAGLQRRGRPEAGDDPETFLARCRGARGRTAAAAAAVGHGHRKLPAMSVRSEEHTSELQSLMRISYAVFCLKKTIKIQTTNTHNHTTKNKLTANQA